MSLLQSIVTAQAAYARCIDEGPLDDWPGFFVEDCVYIVTTADNDREKLPAGLIWADSRNMLVDRVSALRDANIYERHSYRHILGAPAILEESFGEARCETSFLVIRIMRDGSSDVFASGRYVDRYRIGDDRPLLIERTVVCDSSNIDTLLALPL